MSNEILVDRAHRFIIHEVGADMGDMMRAQAEDMVAYLLTGDGSAVMRPKLNDADGPMLLVGEWEPVKETDQ